MAIQYNQTKDALRSLGEGWATMTTMYHVYVLQLSNHQYYVGSTPDLKRRLAEHQTGKAASTKNLRPVKLLWFGSFAGRLLARRFEQYLKSGSGKAFLRKRLIPKE